jgi:hypothetical protein
MKQKHDELAGVCTHPLVDGQRQRDPKGAVSVRALAEKLVGVVWAELMGQGSTRSFTSRKSASFWARRCSRAFTSCRTRALRPEFRVQPQAENSQDVRAGQRAPHERSRHRPFGDSPSVASALPKGLRWFQRRTSLRPLSLSGGV